jgi:hypothetical protein
MAPGSSRAKDFSLEGTYTYSGDETSIDELDSGGPSSQTGVWNGQEYVGTADAPSVDGGVLIMFAMTLSPGANC